MAYKVIEFIVFTQNTQILKIAVFAIKDLRNHKYSPKKPSLNRNFLNLLYMYGIFWVVPGESPCPDGSEYVWQRGVGGL